MHVKDGRLLDCFAAKGHPFFGAPRMKLEFMTTRVLGYRYRYMMHNKFFELGIMPNVLSMCSELIFSFLSRKEVDEHARL